MITIEVNDDAAQRALNQLLEAASDSTPFFSDAGEYLTKSTKDRFAIGEAPDGSNQPSGKP